MSDEIGEYIFYRDNPKWKDVQPVPQDDGPTPIVRIAYSERFEDVYGYMRAVIRSGEKSERVLELTADAVDCNPANYTVWHYRREVLKAINSDLQKELEFIAEIIHEEPKNYQVWYHRQKIVDWIGHYSKGLEFTAEILEDDNKNYHAWQHRQWVIRRFDLWDRELEFVEKMLQIDFRNNSAWNQRYFVLSRGNTVGLTDEVVQREVEFSVKYIRKAPHNESSWNYFEGVLKDRKLNDQPLFHELIKELYSSPVPSPYLLSAMVDLCEERMEDGELEAIGQAKELCELLATKVDQIRKNYWDYTSRRLVHRHTELKKTRSS